jgi:hypothetical protein
MSTKRTISSETPPEFLYHYTDQKGLLGIVKDKEIWATHHQCLNDTQEYLHAKVLIRNEIGKRYETAANPGSRSLLDAMRSTLDGSGSENVDLYVASFSDDGDSLSQFRAYGGQTAGFALGFRRDQLAQAVPKGFEIERCIYEPKEQCELVNAFIETSLEHALAKTSELGDFTAGIVAEADLSLILRRYALIFKHGKFHEEREWRIISPVLRNPAPSYLVPEETELAFRQGKSMLIPYRRVPLKDDKNNFPLHEVVVGPNPNKEQSRRSVQSLLTSQDPVPKARSSDIPYRSW